MMMPGLSSAQCRSMLLYNRNFFVDYNEEQLDHDPRPDLHTYRRQACPERLNITDEALAYWEYEYLQWWDSVGHKPSSTRIRTIEEFQKIQVIVKRRLEACPRWQIYRDNQVKTYGKSGKGGKAKEEVQKWTDTYERVFIEAICLFPPMGRCQMPWPFRGITTKRLGRNELLAMYMEQALRTKILCPWKLSQKSDHHKLTSADYKVTKRKFISSHLQQYRNKYTLEDSILIKYLGKNEDNDRDKRPKAQLRSQNLRRVCLTPDSDDLYDIPRLNFKQMPLPQFRTGELQFPPTSRVFNVMEPKGFKMYLCPKDFPEGYFNNEQLRRYNQAEGLAGRQRRDIHVFTQSFADFRRDDVLYTNPAFPPFISQLYLQNPTVNLIHVEAAMSLSAIRHNDCQIRIENPLRTCQPFEKGYTYKCFNRIFEGNALRAEQEVLLYHDGKADFCQVDFLAEYWAVKIHALIQQRQIDRSIAASELENITAKQDIIMEQTSGILDADGAAIGRSGEETLGSQIPLMTICWTFREAAVDEPARTTWRNVISSPLVATTNQETFGGIITPPILPSQPVQYDTYEGQYQYSLDSQSSADSFERASVELDTVISNTSVESGMADMLDNGADDPTIRPRFRKPAHEPGASVLDFSFVDRQLCGNMSYQDPSDPMTSDGALESVQPYYYHRWPSLSEAQSQAGLGATSLECASSFGQTTGAAAPSIQYPYQQHLSEYAVASNFFSEEVPDMHALVPVTVHEHEDQEPLSQSHVLLSQPFAHVDTLQYSQAEDSQATHCNDVSLHDDVPLVEVAPNHDDAGYPLGYLGHGCGSISTTSTLLPSAM